MDNYAHNDHANALLVYELSQGNLRFEPTSGIWYRWTTHWESTDPLNDIVNAAKYRLVNISAEEREKWAKEADWANKSHNIYHIKATQEVMERLPEFAFPQLNTDPLVFTAANMAINLRTGATHVPTREEGLLIRSSINYDPKATCPTFMAYLASSQPNLDMQQYLARAVGYTLTASMQEQAFFYLLGLPASGKSTFMHVLRGLMGNYGADTNFNTFESTYGSKIPNELAPLRNRRLVIAGEPSRRSRWNDQIIKSITGEDPIVCRYLYKELFTYMPQFKVWIMANWEIGTEDSSYAFFRRVNVIKFENTFHGSARIPKLKEKLTTELSGILNWAIAGTQAWLQSGLRPPALVAAATQEYQESEASNSPGGISLYLEKAVAHDDTCETSGPDFYQHYKNWTASFNMSEREALTFKTFTSQIRTNGYEQIRTAKSRYYKVRLGASSMAFLR